MKKLLITGLILISITLLAAGRYTSNENGAAHRYNLCETLTREQRDQIHSLRESFYRNRQTHIEMIDRKKLQADRLLLEGEADQEEIQRLNAEIERLQAAIKTGHMKYHQEIFEVTGHTHGPGMDSRGKDNRR